VEGCKKILNLFYNLLFSPTANAMKISGMLLFTILLLSANCRKKNENCQWSHFTFDHPVTVYPVKEYYHIGDTLWFEMNFSDVFDATVLNNYNGKVRTEKIQLKDFDFHRLFLRIIQLVDSTQNMNGQPSGAWINSFKPIYEVGHLIQELSNGPEYKLLYENNSYRLKFGMILQEIGLYAYYPLFFHYYPYAEGKLNEVDIRPESKAEHIQDIRFPVNRLADGTCLTNYHLFEQYMNPALETNIDQIRSESFTFVVKE
jgi:hypothetical protein